MEDQALKRLAAAALVFAAALGWRILPEAHVRTLGRLELYQSDTDPYDHARRVELTLEAFPRVPGFDPLADAPFGAWAPWSPVFDGASAVLARGLGTSPAELERLYLWLPPVLGALAPALLAFALWPFGALPALFTGLALAVLPGHRAYTVSARFDHHGAEALALAAFAGGWLSWQRRRDEGGGALIPAALSGVALGLLASLWAGGLVVWAALTAALCLRSRRDGWSPAALAASAATFSLALRAIPGGPGLGEGPALGFHGAGPLVERLAWAAVAAAAALRASARLQDRGAPAWAVWAAPALVALLAAVPAADAAGRVRDWFGFGTVSPDWVFYVSAPESFPLWKDPGKLLVMLGPAAFLLPFLLWGARRAEGWPAGSAAFVGWLALAGWALTLTKARYMYLGAVGLALAEGLAASGWLVSTTWGPRARAAALAAAFLVLHGHQLGSAARGMGADPAKAGALGEGFAWLAANTPEPATPGEYSVLSEWSLGHAIKYLARRPVVADAHGRGTAYLARVYAAREERELASVLAERKVRYLFLTPFPKTGGPAEDAAISRLFFEEEASPRFELLYKGGGLRQIGRRPPTAPVKIFERR